MRISGPGGCPCTNKAGEKGSAINSASFVLTRESPMYAANMSVALGQWFNGKQSTMTDTNEAPCIECAVCPKSGTIWKPVRLALIFVASLTFQIFPVAFIG